MGFAHYSTAGKSGQQAGTVFLAAPYRYGVFTSGACRETRDCSFRNLETPLRSISKSLQFADSQSGKPTACVQPPMLVASIPIQGVTVRYFPPCQDILLQAKCCLHNPGRTGKPRICSLRGLSTPLRYIFNPLQVAESRERNALPALQGQSPKYVLSKGEDAPHAQCFPPSQPSPAVSAALPSPSIPTAASSPLSLCPASRTQPQLPTAVRTVPGFAVHRPAAPQAEDCRLRRQSSAAASSLTAHSPPYTAAYIV